jgi:drug/metabolite transporter (DMT)-like permease
MYYFFLLLTSLLYAGNFVVGKFLIQHTSSLTINELRWGIALIVLIPLVWWKEKRLLPDRRAVIYLILMGLTGIVLFNVFTYSALDFTSPDDVGLLSALNPISIALASFIFLKDRIKKLQSFGMLLSLVGVVVVISHGQWHRLAALHLNVGDLLMLAAVVTWGLFAVAGRKAMQFVSPYMSTLWSSLFGVLIMLPFDLPRIHVENPDASFWGFMLYSAIGGTVIATILWNIGIQQVGPTKSGMFLNFNPIFTAILAFFLLGEGVTVAQVIGTLLVVLGVICFTITGRSRGGSPSGRSNPIKKDTSYTWRNIVRH